MKIDQGNILSPVPVAAVKSNINRRTTGDNKESQNASHVDFRVELSSRLEQMATTSPAEDELRKAKVAAIRDQLASGQYNISGKDVADKILNLLKS